MNTEEKTAHELANDYVNKIEDSFVIGLIQSLEDAHDSGCKCPQCLKRPNTLGKALSNELDRLTPPQPQSAREIVLYERREKRYFNK